MGMVVRTNTMALNANRQLGVNSNKVAKSLEKLSSGFRINRAGDDAAGLAISEKMKAQIKGLEQASSNSQDGISLVQTAEGALTEVHDMLNRMTELATKSANGTIQNDVDREAIQSEVDALNNEIDRISQSTNFNGINLLDGSLSATQGADAKDVVGASVVKFDNPTLKTDAAVNNADLSEIAFTGADVDTLNIDGKEVTVDWSKLNQSVQNNLQHNYSTGASAAPETLKAAAADMERVINDTIDASGNGASHVKVSFDDAGKLAIQSGSTNKDSQVTVTTAGTNSVLKTMGLTTGKNAKAIDQVAGLTANTTDTFKVKIGETEVAAKFAAPIDPTKKLSEVATALTTSLQNAVDAAKTATGDAAFDKAKVSVEVGDNGNFVIKNGLNKDIKISNGSTTLASKLGLDGAASGKGIDGGLTLQIGDTNDKFNKVTVSVDDLSAKGVGTKGLSVANQDDAGKAIQTIRTAINKVSTNRANLGALQNRLEHTINSLNVSAENMTAANSRIRDTDMAKEMMEYTKMNVLTQSAQAMLAQANQQPQSILQLLK